MCSTIVFRELYQQLPPKGSGQQSSPKGFLVHYPKIDHKKKNEKKKSLVFVILPQKALNVLGNGGSQEHTEDVFFFYRTVDLPIFSLL